MQGETMESRSNECHQSLHPQHQCPHISSGFNYRPSNELSESSDEKRFLMACKNGGGENIIRVNAMVGKCQGKKQSEWQACEVDMHERITMQNNKDCIK